MKSKPTIPAAATADSDPHGKGPHESGAKLDAGKIKAALLGDFSRALLAVADVGTYGADKYTRDGWQFVPDGSTRYLDAFWRHLLEASISEHDAESGRRHLTHAAWNLLAVLELNLRRG